MLGLVQNIQKRFNQLWNRASKFIKGKFSMYLQYLPRTYQNKLLVTTMDLFYQLYTDLQIHSILPKMLVFNSTLEYIPALPSTKKKKKKQAFLPWQALYYVSLPGKWKNSILFYLFWFSFLDPMVFVWFFNTLTFQGYSFPFPPPKANQNWPGSLCCDQCSALAIRK